MPTDPPVAGKQGEGSPRARIFRASPGNKLREHDQTIEDQEVQRPDAQDATHIKGLELDSPSLVGFPGVRRQAFGLVSDDLNSR